MIKRFLEPSKNSNKCDALPFIYCGWGLLVNLIDVKVLQFPVEKWWEFRFKSHKFYSFCIPW